ncbi:Isoprene synthase [Rhynchospora pubera]|uniref:Isoprene synthase n=1 Tax=Rhynchospora pubera TaxID=906938 RepID=A0AAV8CD10_9POAL|nr:Isoprene synthase [Rhynchospora pubera]
MGSYTSPICNLQRPSMHPDPVVRRSANYKPTLWRNDFIQSLRFEGINKSEISNYYGELKTNIRSQIVYKESQLAAKLKMVDMLQRLGVAYHFSGEIEHMLEEIIMDDAIATLKNDFASFALLFRLMRTNCYHIPQDILLSTMSMKDNMQNDINGLHSLYETTFLALDGEKSLEDARVFSTRRLKELMKTCVDQRVKTQLDHALEVPLHWRAPRLEARWFIDQCHANVDVDPVVKNFAKLDYNQVQLLHQEELAKLSRWWAEIGLKDKLHFARDRLVEIFFLATGIAPEPHNSDSLLECRLFASQKGVPIPTRIAICVHLKTLPKRLRYSSR